MLTMSRSLRLFLTLTLTLPALLASGCGRDAGTGSLSFALGYYGDDLARFTLKVYRGAPAGQGEEPELEYVCRSYEYDGFRVSGIAPGDDYHVVFRGYRDEACTDLAFVSVRGRNTVAEDEDEQGRYYLPLLKMGASTALADPGFSNLGQLNSAPCDPLDDKCGGYFPELSDATCSATSFRCRVACTADADCTPRHPKAVCDDDGVEQYCVFSDAFPLNNASARGFGAAVALSDGSVGFLGGLDAQPGGVLEPASVPVEHLDAGQLLFDAPLDVGFLPSAFGGVVQVKKDAYAVIGGLARLTITPDQGGLAFTLCPEGAASCGFVDSVQVYDFGAGKSYASALTRAVAMPVVWRLNEGVAAVFGGVAFEGNDLTLSRNGLLCSYAGFPDVACDAYDGVLSGPRVGHAGVCVKATGEVPFSCDEFLVLGGNSPDSATTLGDLMVVEKKGSSYSIKPVPLTMDEDAADDPVAHAFGLQPFQAGARWFTVGGARFRAGAVGIDAPDLGAYRYVLDAAGQSITPIPVAVEGLPAGGATLLHRVFHQIVTFATDTGTAILVVGGLDATGRATDSVLVLEEQEGALRFVREIKLARARFGATIAPLDNPCLPDAGLVAGGVRVSKGALVPVYGSEVILQPVE